MIAMRMLLHEIAGSLSRHTLRIGLTLLGVIWGIATLVILISIPNGYQREFTREMSATGKTHWNLEVEVWANLLRKLVRYPPVEDIEELLRLGPFFESGTIDLRTEMRISSRDLSRRFPVFGSMPAIASVLPTGYSLYSGRFLADYDLDTHARVVILGATAASELFPENISLIGECVFVEGQSFTVVGVLNGDVPASSRGLVIPYTTYLDIAPPYIGRGMTPYSGGSWCRFLFKLKSPSYWDEAGRLVSAEVSERYSIDEKAVKAADNKAWNEKVQRLARMYYIVFITIGLITLTIGAVGTMNIMLVSVRERTREIGIRRAVGATSRQIGLLFLAEALGITTIGGLIGLILGLDGVAVLRMVKISEDFPTPEASLGIVVIALLVNVVVGLVAGAYPALQALRMDPIECLRHE